MDYTTIKIDLIIQIEQMLDIEKNKIIKYLIKRFSYKNNRSKNHCSKNHRCPDIIRKIIKILRNYNNLENLDRRKILFG